jgi:hypothetical protein
MEGKGTKKKLAFARDFESLRDFGMEVVEAMEAFP